MGPRAGLSSAEAAGEARFGLVTSPSMGDACTQKTYLGRKEKVLRAPVLSWHYLRSPCPVHAADSQSHPLSLFKRERIRAAEPLALMIDSIILNSNCRKKKKERVSPMIKPTARRGGLPLKFFT